MPDPILPETTPNTTPAPDTNTTLNLGVATDITTTEDGVSSAQITLDIPEEFQFPTELAGQVTQSFEDINATINMALEEIKNIDTGAIDAQELAGTLTAGFEETKSSIINAATRKTQLNFLKLDAFLGSTSADARAAARFRIGQDVTNNLTTEAFNSVNQVINTHTQNVVNTLIQGAQVGSQIASQKAAAIGSLAQASASLFKGLVDSQTNLYTSRMQGTMALVESSFNFFQAQLNAETANRQMDISAGLEQQRIDIAASQSENAAYSQYINAFKAGMIPKELKRSKVLGNVFFHMPSQTFEEFRALQQQGV